MLYDAPDILQEQICYRDHLYSTRTRAESADIQAYLDRVSLAWMEGPMLKHLAAPVTEEEIMLAIETLPTCKAPGNDGPPSEFYKAYAAALTAHLLNVCVEAFDVGVLPLHLERL